jgi:hypothetical protein
MENLTNSFDYNYFMNPYIMENVGKIYPIKYKDYYKFMDLAENTLLYSIDNLNNLKRIQFETLKYEGKIDRFEKFKDLEFDNLFDYVINLSFQYDEIINKIKEDIQTAYSKVNDCFIDDDIRNNIKFIEYCENNIPKNKLKELLEMLLKKEVEITKENIFIYEEKNIVGNINKDNFDKFRDIVMKNNLLYEPLVGYDLNSNEIIKKAIKSKSEKGKKSSLESVIGIVSINRNLSDKEIQEYTIYRLYADFELISRQHYNQLYFMLKTVGSSVDLMELSEEINIYKNPYKGLLSKHEGYNELDSMLEKS